MDGTFRSGNSLSNIDRAVRKKYIIKIMYIHQEPRVAWSFTQARERIEKRAIDKQGFIQAYFDIHANIELLAAEEYANVSLDIIVKDENNAVGQWHKNVSIKDIDSLVSSLEKLSNGIKSVCSNI